MHRSLGDVQMRGLYVWHVGKMASFKGFGKRLASTEAQVRSEAMKELSEKIVSDDLSLVDCKKVWKALFYCMWMCDGKENQASLADDLGALVPAVRDPWTWVAAFFEVMRLEWATLDRFRFDKFMYLVRVYLHKTMELAESDFTHWNSLMKSLLDKCLYKGLAMAFHIFDVFEEERPVKKRKSSLKLLRPVLEFAKDVKLQHIAEAVYAKVLAKFIAKEKYKEALRSLVREVIGDDASAACGIEMLRKCLQDNEPASTPAAESELPPELSRVMQRFYPEKTPSPKKRRPKPDFIPEKKPANFEDISIPLPTPLKKHTRESPMAESQIGSGVKKRKVMFNLKLNTTQHFAKNEIVSKEATQPVPVPPKGMLRVQSAMKAISAKRTKR